MAVDDSFTKSLLHFDGTDTSTTFTDESGKTWTANGNAQLDTAQKKFGSAAGLFDGTGDWIDTPDSADFDVGSGDFTIDFWVRKNADGARQIILGQLESDGTGALLIEFQADNTVRGIFTKNDDTTFYLPVSAGTITVDSTWHHIALVRDTTTLRLFLDGTADGTAAVGTDTLFNSPSKYAIGRGGEFAGLYLNGWIDEVRFSKGVARWTSNFTPPTAPYAPPSSEGNFFYFL